MTDERILKLYKLNLEHWALRNKYSFYDKIYVIIDHHRRYLENDDAIGREVPHLYYGRLHSYLYDFRTPEFTSPWGAFFPDYFSSRGNLTVAKFNFVLFIHDDAHLYAIVGGSGTFAIKQYVDTNFGMDMLTRIIQPERDNVLLAELRGITGNIAGRSELYREEQKIIDIDSFGRIFKKVKFEISPETLLDYFGVDINNLRKNQVFVEVSDALSLRLSLSFDDLCIYIRNCSQILGQAQRFEITTFVPIVDEELIRKRISIQLFLTIQQRLQVEEIQRGELLFFDYDICHPTKTQEFYECDTYQLYGNRDGDPDITCENKRNLLELALDYAKQNIDYQPLRNVMSFLSGLKVRGIREETVITNAPLLEHLSCEIFFDNSNIYKIDGSWYSVRDNFVHHLNQYCSQIFINQGINYEEILPVVWLNPDTQGFDEDWYNTRYFAYGDYIVLDKVISQNIELCDLLLSGEEDTYLIHVKKGFNGMMRDLTNQVRIAARRLWIDLHSEERTFLNELYEKLTGKENFQHCGSPTIEEFLSLFTNKRLHFVIAFCSMNKTGRRVFDQIETFQSNIAKFALSETVREMKSQDYNVYVCEIEHRFE